MENPNYHLEGIVKSRDEMEDFEGPLSLILMLLSKNKIEIRDVRIADIVDQYLAYLQTMQDMNLEIASESVQMASHLVYIKTKALLTGDEEVSELEQLLSSLEQLQNRERMNAVREMVPAIASALELGLGRFSTPREPLPKYGVYEYSHEPWELLAAFASMITRPVAVEETDTRVAAIPRPMVYSTRDKSRQILQLMRDGQERLPLRQLYAMAAGKSEIVATFLSVLEMCAMGSVCLEREEDGWCLRFLGGDTEEILENISE